MSEPTGATGSAAIIAAGAASAVPLLELRDVAKVFDVSPPWLDRVLGRKPRLLLRAVDGVSLSIARGETLAVVGESGCGKSTVARMIVGLYRPSRGEILFEGRPITAGATAHSMRRPLQMIFQDPYASLNPRWRVRGGPSSWRCRSSRTTRR